MYHKYSITPNAENTKTQNLALQNLAVYLANLYHCMMYVIDLVLLGSPCLNIIIYLEQ